MTIEQLRRFHTTRPFRPFDIYLADGRQIRVDHPEILASSPTGRTIAVYSDPEAAEIIDLLLVTSIKPVNGASSRRRR
jgi:hypothetical protein